MPRRKHDGISDQRKASSQRWRDFQALLERKRWRGSMYLAGYSVECLIKAKLMETWKCVTLMELEDRLAARSPEGLFHHNLAKLLGVLGVRDRMQQNADIWVNFRQANLWQPSWRYSPNNASQAEAEVFLAAVRRTLDWLEHNC